MSMSDGARRTGGARLISADELSAYERWELPTVEEGMDHHDAASLGDKVESSPNLLTASQIEEFQQQAYQEGYQAGFTQGREDGVQAGRDEMQQAALRLSEALGALSQPFEELDTEVEAQLAALALSVARQIIRRELRTDPGQVVSVVREALGVLPAASRHIRVRLHPDDAQLMREALALGDDADRAWQIVDDPVLTRGGCLVETEFSNVDASVERRINAVVAQVLGGERGADRLAPGMPPDGDTRAADRQSAPHEKSEQSEQPDEP